jgi:hypothetical protein
LGDSGSGTMLNQPPPPPLPSPSTWTTRPFRLPAVTAATATTVTHALREHDGAQVTVVRHHGAHDALMAAGWKGRDAQGASTCRTAVDATRRSECKLAQPGGAGEGQGGHGWRCGRWCGAKQGRRWRLLLQQAEHDRESRAARHVGGRRRFARWKLVRQQGVPWRRGAGQLHPRGQRGRSGGDGTGGVVIQVARVRLAPPGEMQRAPTTAKQLGSRLTVACVRGQQDVAARRGV